MNMKMDAAPRIGSARDDGNRFDVKSSAQVGESSIRVRYLVDGVLAEGEPCILAGATKSMKTSIAVDLAVSLASGADFLGRFPVARSATTLLMSGESGMGTLRETAIRVCQSKGLELATDLGRLYWHDRLPQLGNAKDIAKTEQTIVDFGIEVLIIDPLYLCMNLGGGRESSMFEVGERLRTINDVCARHGTTLILLHHTKGGPTRRAPQLGDIAWAGFDQWARQWVLLGRRQKYQPGTGSHKLWLSLGGSAGHSSLWGVEIEEGVLDPELGLTRKWDVRVVPGQASSDSQVETRTQRATSREANTRAKVLDAIAAFPGGATENDIRQHCQSKISQPEVKRAKNWLLKTGKIVDCSIHKNGRDYSGVRLQGDTTCTPPV